MNQHRTVGTNADADGAITEVIETDGELIARLGHTTTNLVVMPSRRLEDGRGVYPEDCIFLVKELRAAGHEASFLDDSENRVFEVKKSLLALVVSSVVLGVAGNAGWDAIKWIVQRAKGDEVPLQITQFDRSELAGGRTWSVTGSPQRVLAALETLQSGEPQVTEPLPSSTDDSGGNLDAGPDDDLNAAYMRGQVETHLRNADAQLAAARNLASSTVDRDEAELVARRGLASFASALNWAEDTDAEEDVHRRMDAAGLWVRSTFGCALTFDGASYFEDCPVALAHNRIGLSVGGVATRVCSLCGLDLSDCEHRRGRAYLVAGGTDQLGWCRVCLRKDGCDHESHLQYRAPVVSVITKMDLEEVSIVGRSAHPDARITRRSVPLSDLRRRFGNQFKVGTRVDCNKCRSACGGLIRNDDVLHG